MTHRTRLSAGYWLKKIQLTLLPEVNLNETEGMPEKARKGYAALSGFIGSNLEKNKMEL